MHRTLSDARCWKWCSETYSDVPINYETDQDAEVRKGATGRKMQGGGSIRRDMMERFNEVCAGALCLTKNPERKFFLADVLGDWNAVMGKR